MRYVSVGVDIKLCQIKARTMTNSTLKPRSKAASASNLKPSSTRTAAAEHATSLETLLESVSDYSKCTLELAARIRTRLAPLLAISNNNLHLNHKKSASTLVTKDSISNITDAMKNVNLGLSLELRTLKSFALKLLHQLCKTLNTIPTTGPSPEENATSVSVENVKPMKSKVNFVKVNIAQRSGPGQRNLPNQPTVVKDATSESQSQSCYFSVITQICADAANSLEKLERHESGFDQKFIDFTKKADGYFRASYWNFETEKALSNVITRLIEANQILHAETLLKSVPF
ncbi:hypothetical protein BDR26DRAFT_27393 [Obelidium mucronatum]|nr:hypothetical protein BDR26DRAFT_27393 [Obelidium mucronatum]